VYAEIAKANAASIKKSRSAQNWAEHRNGKLASKACDAARTQPFPLSLI
jgi:hypothetical protein